MNKIRFILICILSLVSCSINREDSSLSVFDITKLNSITEIKLSDVRIDDIKYIPLETNDKVLIPSILAVEYSNNSYFVNIGKTIYRFDNAGRFLTQIGKNGRGPNEYQFVNCFDIEKMSGDVFIGSGFTNELYVFSSSNGEFIKNFPSPEKRSQFCIIDEKIIFYCDNYDALYNNSFELFDLNGSILKSYPNKYPYENNKNKVVFLHENLFYKSNNQLFKKEIFSDTIFKLNFNNYKFKPSIVLQQGEKLMPSRVRENYDIKLINENFYTQFNLLNFGNNIFYEFLIDDKFYSFIGNIDSGATFLSTQKKGFINDIDGGNLVKFKTSISDNKILSWVSAYELKQHVASDAFKNSTPKYPEKKKELEKLANSLDDNDNRC